MPENKKINSKFKIIKPYLYGVFKGFIVFAVLFLITAFVMYKFNFDSPIMYYLIYFYILLGGFTSAVCVYKKVKGRGFLTGITASFPFSMIAFLLISLISGFSISGNILLTFVLTISGGFLGGVIAANTKI